MVQCALPKEWYQEEGLYTIRGTIINNEYRLIARRVDAIELGLENEDFYQVKNGMNAGEKIIVEGGNEVLDGCEVYVMEESEK